MALHGTVHLRWHAFFALIGAAGPLANIGSYVSVVLQCPRLAAAMT
jgi:hypothetical protein